MDVLMKLYVLEFLTKKHDKSLINDDLGVLESERTRKQSMHSACFSPGESQRGSSLRLARKFEASDFHSLEGRPARSSEVLARSCQLMGNLLTCTRQCSPGEGVQNYLERVDSLHHILLERDLQQEYNHILFHEEMHWYQKSREQWVKFSHKNSAFFHTQTIIRRKRNRVHRLQLPNGTWSTNSSVLQNEAQQYYKNFFSGNETNHAPSFYNGLHPTIDEEGKNSLLRHVTIEEVYSALNSMKPYKVPGPYGFQCIFFKQYWHIVGDIFYLVRTAFHTGYFNPAISETLISLILKIDPPTTFKDFRPISLCNIVYKINMKVLDIIHFMRKLKKKKDYVAFKLDLEKAFDNVNWEFLKTCLHDFGFFDATTRLIMHCVTSSNFSLLWNGNKMPPFKPTLGLRQGDPLSPYLFILCMETLSIAITDAVHQGLKITLSKSRAFYSTEGEPREIALPPQSICDSIDQITRNFIWRDFNNKGIHLVGWNKDMVQSSSKLWVDLLSSKYVFGSTFLLSSTLSSGSSTWSSIIRAKDILKDSFSWRVGSGSSSFWFTPWTALGSLVPYVDIHDLRPSVKDVISTGNPHTQCLYTHLPSLVSDVINNTNFKFNDSIKDAFIWTNNKNDIYTTKSGYSWLFSLRDPVTNHNPSHSWSWIWKLQLPEKIKFFFWLACHNSSPTLSLLNHRKMNPSATCTCCGLRDESFLHCIRDCGIIRNTFGHYLTGFSGFIQGSSDILITELHDIYKGLLLAKDMSIDELVCYSDSLHCVNLVNGPQVK
ncbi:hypothetical protein TSUD_235210 [Trifolium subterraneum]|uniref:Reverse transcriptase domain-containing protein n=1 Tax=Trifolium subterraneum TaxID=3900 RepID=A0A2Z6P216_TRISU|nr:hypothetical protein TSUD_235210 [Trifolium subterraneum]